jgi:20S proteasome alpha/beta subunit
MTFVIGFRCSNGIVLCTDSLEADGLTKRYVNKTKIIGTADWGVAIAGAGPGGLLDKFTSDVSANLPRGQYNRKGIESTIEDALSSFRLQYQEPFRILVGVQCTRAIDYGLYRSDDNYLVPIKDHAHVGMGHSLWRLFAENLYKSGNSVEDNSRLAIFIMRQAINYVDGVDEPIRLATYTSGGQNWNLRVGPLFLTIERYAEGFRYCDIGEAIKDSWKSCNPPSLPEQMEKFGGVKIPGDELTFLDGVKVEELKTFAGQMRASNSLIGNRDKLRKRGILEKERAQKSGEQS